MIEDGADVVEGVVVAGRLAVAHDEVGEGRVGAGEEAEPAGEEVGHGSGIQAECLSGAVHGQHDLVEQVEIDDSIHSNPSGTIGNVNRVIGEVLSTIGGDKATPAEPCTFPHHSLVERPGGRRAVSPRP